MDVCASINRGRRVMKLRVDDITAEAREVSFVESEGEINRTIRAGGLNEYRLDRPVRVELSHYRAGTELFLTGEVDTYGTAWCARCTEEFQVERSRAFRYVLAPKVVGYDTEAGQSSEDLEFSLYEGDEVDLTPLVREQVLLALTERPLCREDCRGLCPHCGANLNESACDCRGGKFDPRLAVLRTLKVGRS
jgi:uncharacterized protein